ncbi:unnamed protein product [Brugia pahangi]|uniref:Sema domain-containing protein n=1 Tax=Brugia pahangi TaxID=6280 RepID=A0A0N4T2M5_BRUPA|nr:unnamed protein product [Brugia pahangi]
MLHLLIIIQARDCNIRNYLDVNYFHASNDSSSIVGVTSACTVFIVPDSVIPNSNFLEELKLIDSDRRKVCYGVNVHILQSRQLIVLFLRQAHFAVAVSCDWKFSGKLFYCNPDDVTKLLFIYEHQKRCTNLILFDKGISFFCALSDNMLEKITYFNSESHIKFIRTRSTSLFLKENSNIILVTNDTSSRAGFYEMNIFDNVYVEQLANDDIYNNKAQLTIGLLESKKYAVTFMEIHKRNSENISLQRDLANYITMYQTKIVNQTKWYCIARFDESGYMDAKRYKNPNFKKFVLTLYENIVESKKGMNIFKESVVRYEIIDEVRFNYAIRAVILMIPILSVLLAAIILIINIDNCSKRFCKKNRDAIMRILTSM